MSESNIPTISSLFSVPTLAENGRFQLAVGIQLSDGQRFWATCHVTPAASRSEAKDGFDAGQAAKTVKSAAGSLWRGKSAAEFRPLAQSLLTVTEYFTYTKADPVKLPSAVENVSRRRLLTGFMTEEDGRESKQEIVTVERPLHPAAQYGLTAALLKAVAAVNRMTVTELLAQEFGLKLEPAPVPLQIPLNDQNVQAMHAVLASHVASLGYTTSKNNHKATFGEKGERLQQHIRQIAAWLPTLNSEYRPALHLDLGGGFGELFDHKSGKILGALFGLEHAAKPYLLQIQNPMLRESREEQLRQLTELQNFVQIRKLKLKLVGDAWVDSFEDVKLFVQQHAGDLLHLSLPRLGNLEQGITAVLYAKSQNLPVILSGANSPLTTQIALALGPSLLQGPPLTHYNEMQKILSQT